MSREGVERIVEKALADESFRCALFTDPKSTCLPFKITEDEFEHLLGRALSPNRQSEPENAGY